MSQNFSLMKLLRNYGITIVVALTIVMTSCGGGPIEHGTEYVMECDASTDTVDINAAYLVIQNRLNNFDLQGDFELSRKANRITIKVRSGAALDNSKIRDLLQSSANLSFRAMYNFSEISGEINAANETYLRVSGIDSLNASGAGLSGLIVAPGSMPDGPLLFGCRALDTTAVMDILRHDSIAILFPSDLVFHWGTGPDLETGEKTYGLFACKEGRNYAMNGNYVESASAVPNTNLAMWEISLTFDAVGAMEFAKITKANVGRSLAIELDNFVYNYPIVNAEITGGVAMITGYFSEEEAHRLSKILSAGSLPVPFTIVKETEF